MSLEWHPHYDVWALIISLIIFLLVASYHFGKEDTQFLINENSYFNQLLFFLKGLLIINRNFCQLTKNN